MAGGKGTRMGSNAIEKPMQIVGGKPVVMRVVEAMQGCRNVDNILVSVSSNTPNTERFLQDLGVETICTSGNDFMEDMHTAFGMLNSEFIVTCPSDLPLIRSYTVDSFIDFFRPEMESAIAVVDKGTVVNSYSSGSVGGSALGILEAGADIQAGLHSAFTHGRSRLSGSGLGRSGLGGLHIMAAHRAGAIRIVDHRGTCAAGKQAHKQCKGKEQGKLLHK